MNSDPILEARRSSPVMVCRIFSCCLLLREKKVFVALMARLVMMASIDPSMDDKDYYGNKQLNLAGFMIACFFEDLLQVLYHCKFTPTKSWQNRIERTSLTR